MNHFDVTDDCPTYMLQHFRENYIKNGEEDNPLGWTDDGADDNPAV